MRSFVKWTLLSVALCAAACSRAKAPTTSMSDDLRRDLQLAGQQPQIQISPDEISPQSHKAVAMKPVAAPHGPTLVRSKHPTIKAAPKPTVVADAPKDIPQVQVMASAPAPSETPAPDAPPIARPAEIPTSVSPGAGTMPGPSRGTAQGTGEGTGSGVGGIGGIIGVIFGGGVDDDHCDPRGGARRLPGGGIYGGGTIFGRGGGGVYRHPHGMQ